MQCPECGHQAPVADFGDPLRCPDCGIYYEKAVQLKAQAASASPNSPQQEQPSRPAPPGGGLSLKGFMTILLLGIGLLAVLLAPKKDTDAASAAKSDSKCGDASMAHIMAGNFVKRQLVAPTTAKFPYPHDRDVVIVPMEKCRFQILSYVDSQNAFGAKIRSRFTVTMESLEGGDTWRAHDLVIE